MNLNVDNIQLLIAIIETFFIFSISNEFAHYKSRRSITGLLPWVIGTFVFEQLIAYIIGGSSYRVCLNIVLISIAIFLAYKEDPIRPFFGQIFVNVVGIISNLAGLSIYMIITSQKSVNINQNGSVVIFIWFVEIIFLVVTYKNRKKVAVNFDKVLKNKYILFIIALVYQVITIVSVIIMIKFKYESKSNNILGISILIGILILFMLLFMIQFAKMYVRYCDSKTMLEELAIKNDELRKIKHDYASQLSFLYALYQLNRLDKLGEMMKQTIETSNSISGTIEICDTENPVFISALKLASKVGVHFAVEDSVDMEILDMEMGDLAKIVLNIVNNAIRALEDTPSPFIKIYTIDAESSIYITIENNGPQIPKEILNKIFIKGFTTKNEKTEEHGYGLAIVKELVEKYNGEISIKSDNIKTEFNIIFPKRIVASKNYNNNDEV